MQDSPVKVGIIGCGNISGAYLRGNQAFQIFDIVACADLDVARAKAKAEEFGVPKACDVQTLLNDPEIEIVINLTIPRAHGPVALEAIQAGKSVYNEKPLALSRGEGQSLLEAARAKNLLVGCAPDTFLGGAFQTCRQLIDAGQIGEPVAAFAAMMSHGHETWHPDPDFYYQPGGGPMFDMGPYYLTALINFLGPVRRVTGSTRITFPERTITSQPKHGTVIQVNVPTHVVGVMDFASGPIATIITTFDVWAAHLPCIEIYGTEGSLSVPDPNNFGGTVRIKRAEDSEWREVEHTHTYYDPGRSIGVADMAYALRRGRPHRANGDLAYHVLDLMHAFHDASEEGRHIEMQSTCTRPAPLPPGSTETVLQGDS
ncbi:MAG: Gfo/Idh/MocA family oxidoreductase [Abitibacteriaceae bacterium]|nr:Gfo/Idh/MocA family oxidoreductase [Abditibacteriaceae bacterium]MBV9868130.1 Gfo/Idh/MocA family oxidoreductase [Abditibacteriaceae bacterium]